MSTFGTTVASRAMRTGPDAKQPLTMPLNWASLTQHLEIESSEGEAGSIHAVFSLLTAWACERHGIISQIFSQQDIIAKQDFFLSFFFLF